MERNRRRIATIAFLLASFLEICGCNPVRTCEQLRLTRMSAMPWESLVQQCAECLSSYEMSALRQVADGPIEWKSATWIMADRTVDEALLELRGPSFGAPDAPDAPVTPPASRVGVRHASSISGASGSGKQPIAWPIPASVLFLYDGIPGADAAARRIGTGFLLSVPNPRHRQMDRYLVTARHVVEPQWAGCQEKNPRSITVRFNSWTGGVGYETIVLDSPRSPAIMTPTDDLTDLAMVPLDAEMLPRLESYKLTEIRADQLPTNLELGALHQDQRIVTAGISLPRMNGLSEFPISAPGVITATASNVPVKVRCSAEAPAKPIQLWMIDASIPAGVSGAPVYAELARGPHGEPEPVLVGVQSAVWPGKGVAGITPVGALTELIQVARNRDQIAIDFRRGLPWNR